MLFFLCLHVNTCIKAKFNALINLSEKLGFLQKEVVAMGDSNNDLDIIYYVK